LRAPKWLWVGAFMGVFIVLTITVAAPEIGVVAVTALLIAGQLGTAVLIDRFGVFGVERIGLSWPRVVGIALLVAGAALTLRR
jgi:bacterial/archaeal transporter family-2 protein